FVGESRLFKNEQRSAFLHDPHCEGYPVDLPGGLAFREHSSTSGTVVRGGGAAMSIAGSWVEWLWAVADLAIAAVLPLVFLLPTMLFGRLQWIGKYEERIPCARVEHNSSSQ
ncbi:Leucine-rich repeat protein kinase family protein, partial [Prunus dulcis]